jgi:hypothetical protein
MYTDGGGRSQTQRQTKENVDENVRGRYDKMCSVASRCKVQKRLEREDPWCETANHGKPEHTIGVLTKGSAVKPTCICVLHDLTYFDTITKKILQK